MKKWVKALRSGKFKQGTGILKQFNSKGEAEHCCLGVLCELYNQDMKKNKKKMLPEKILDNDSDFSHGYTKFDNRADVLPNSVAIWAGMDSDNPRYIDSMENVIFLSDLNDTGRKFKTIANIIEKNWENL